VAGSCEHGNETSGFIKGGEFLDYLSDYLASQEGLCSMELVPYRPRNPRREETASVYRREYENSGITVPCWTSNGKCKLLSSPRHII
jgi:hypothetical protein